MLRAPTLTSDRHGCSEATRTEPAGLRQTSRTFKVVGEIPGVEQRRVSKQSRRFSSSRAGSGAGWTRTRTHPRITCGTRPTHLVHKLQLLPSADEPIGVDEAAAHGLGVEDHVSGHAHQDVPVVPRVGEATHCHAETTGGGCGVGGLLLNHLETRTIWRKHSSGTSCVAFMLIQMDAATQLVQ